ncbi:MAG: beta-galactosidase [Brotaphodocola sp.]
MRSKYGYTKDYLTRDGEPWFPVMGEFHFSRYPERYWKESIFKMKAGGVDIVSTYVFWIHHEEIKGEYDFSGQRNLRKFTETVKSCGMKMFLRIGPWCHGEVRNGGFPDWLLHEAYVPRTNDERYFAEVKRFYTEIFRQVDGLLHADGGPVIGIQIENEYGHCGGLQGPEGEAHMRRLTEIAKESGLVVPLYTATGWGGAATGGLLPVMGGYCEAPWEQSTEELPPNENYVFTCERNDDGIGSDYGRKQDITFDMAAFPYLTAELGGGLQVTHHRRPIADAKDIGAMSLVKIGSGVNLIGYYMYHGGTNPEGKCSTLQESRETGYLNDLPVFSYDFSAPIREYGQISDTAREIKLLAMFVRDFGSDLCEMEPELPEKLQDPADFENLRFSVRRNRQNGYLFVNNYQRRHTMKEHIQKELKVRIGQEEILYSPMDIRNGDYFFLPFHMKVGDGELKSAAAVPLCRLHAGRRQTYVFYTDGDPAYNWEKVPADAGILTISREMALNAWKFSENGDYLIFTEGSVIETDEGYELLERKTGEMKSFPALSVLPQGYFFDRMEGEISVYRREESVPETRAFCNLVKEENDKKLYEIRIEYPEGVKGDYKQGELNDCFLRIGFSGDQARLYVDGQWKGDWYYTGRKWEIGMKRYDFPEIIQIEVYALKENDEIFLETVPEFENGTACRIDCIAMETEIALPFCVWLF